MAFSNDATLLNAPRRMHFSVISAKNRSTWFSHELLVGMECRWYSGCRSSHRLTARVLWVA